MILFGMDLVRRSGSGRRAVRSTVQPSRPSRFTGVSVNGGKMGHDLPVSPGAPLGIEASDRLKPGFDRLRGRTLRRYRGKRAQGSKWSSATSSAPPGRSRPGGTGNRWNGSDAPDPGPMRTGQHRCVDVVAEAQGRPAGLGSFGVRPLSDIGQLAVETCSKSSSAKVGVETGVAVRPTSLLSHSHRVQVLRRAPPASSVSPRGIAPGADPLRALLHGSVRALVRRGELPEPAGEAVDAGFPDAAVAVLGRYGGQRGVLLSGPCTPTLARGPSREQGEQKLFGLPIWSTRTRLWIGRGHFRLPRTGFARPA